MASKWTAYSEDMRLGQGFNSYVQETRVNDAVLITKTPKQKAVERASATARPPSSSAESLGTTLRASSDSDYSKPADPVEDTSRSLKSPRVGAKSDISGAVSQLQQNGLLDHEMGATLLSLVNAVATPEVTREEEKAVPVIAAAAAAAAAAEELDPTIEDDAATFWGLNRKPKDKTDKTDKKTPKKRTASKKQVEAKETEKAPPIPIPPFPCNMTPTEDAINQRVTFTSKEVSDQKDIHKILGVSASASVKSGNLGGDVGGSYDCENELKAADMSFVVHVRVSNEAADYDETMKFRPIDGLTERLKNLPKDGSEFAKPEVEFTKVYGDCFIADFTTGGELFAIIHITSHDKQNMRAIRLHATAQLSPPTSPVNVGAAVKSSSESSGTFDDSELSINLIWRGGGEIKIPNVNWDIPTLMRVANAFPNLVSRSHAKIGATLMPYTSLRSYQEWCLGAGFGNLRLDYSHCGPFADILYAEYCDFGAIAEAIGDIVANPSEYRSGAPRKPEKSSTALAGKAPSKQTMSFESDTKDFRPRTFSEAARQATWGNLDDYDGEEDDFDPEGTEPLSMNPETLRNARLFCVHAMSMIQQRVQTITVDPSAPETFLNYPCPARFRRRLPRHKYSDKGEGLQYDDKDPMIPAELAVSRTLFYADKLGDDMSKHRKYENFAIGNLTIKERMRDIYDIKIHPYVHRGWLSRSKASKSYDNAITGITFVYCNVGKKESDKFDATMRYPVKVHHVGKGTPPKLPDNSEKDEDKAKSMSSKQMQAKFDEMPAEKLLPLDIRRLEVYWEPGAGCIAGLAFYDGQGVQEHEISHYQWGKKKDPVPESMECTTYYFENQQRFAGLVGSFQCLSGIGARQVLARCSVVYGHPDGSGE